MTSAPWYAMNLPIHGPAIPAVNSTTRKSAKGEVSGVDETDEASTAAQRSIGSLPLSSAGAGRSTGRSESHS